MPLHVWLPSAHAMAPEPCLGDHVGRPHQDGHLRAGPGDVTDAGSSAGLGRRRCWRWASISGVLGVVFAIGQHDLKRLLAYHSIENIGIIVMGLGLALIGRSTGSRRMGGARPGRRAAARLEPRAVQGPAVPRAPAPSSTPPTRARSTILAGWRRRCRRTVVLLPGRGGRDLRPAAAERLRQRVPDLPRPVPARLVEGTGLCSPAASFAAPALALIGALAVACFVKVYGAVFLGAARSEHAAACPRVSGRP